jgi:hypothetical protein
MSRLSAMLGAPPACIMAYVPDENPEPPNLALEAPPDHDSFIATQQSCVRNVRHRISIKHVHTVTAFKPLSFLAFSIFRPTFFLLWSPISHLYPVTDSGGCHTRFLYRLFSHSTQSMPRDMSYRKPVPIYIPSPPSTPALPPSIRLSLDLGSGTDNHTPPVRIIYNDSTM